MIGASLWAGFLHMSGQADAGRLSGNRTADPRLVFAVRTAPLLPKFEFQALAVFCSRTARLVSDLIGGPEQRGSLFHAHGNE